MSGSFTSPKEENKDANLPVFASMPTLLFTPCSQAKVNGRQMMIYRLAGGLSTIRPMSELPHRPPQTNQMLTSNSQSNLRMVAPRQLLPKPSNVSETDLKNDDARKPSDLDVEDTRKPLTPTLEGTRQTLNPTTKHKKLLNPAPEDVRKPSILRMVAPRQLLPKPSNESETDLKNDDARKPSDLDVEDTRKPLTPTLEGTRQTLSPTTNHQNLFNPAPEDVRNPSILTTDNTSLPTVSSVWSLAGSAEYEQTGSPFIPSKPPVISVDDLKNCDAGCSGNGENPTPVLCVANANAVLKEQEESTQYEAPDTLHSAWPASEILRRTASEILREQRRQNSDGIILSPRVITDSTIRASSGIHLFPRRHVTYDHCYADNAVKANYTHISPKVRHAIINRKVKRTVSNEKDIGTEKEFRPVVSKVTANLDKQDERPTSVNEMKWQVAPMLHLNDAGSFSEQNTSNINSANSVSLQGRQTVNNFSVIHSKRDTTFTRKLKGVSMAVNPHMTNSTISLIDEQRSTSANPTNGEQLSSTRPKSPVVLPREKPLKVVSLMKINLPGVLLHNKQMFACMEVEQSANDSSAKLDNDPLSLSSPSSVNQTERGLVNTEKRPPVKFKSLLGHCRVVIKRLPIKRKYCRTKTWKKYLENELSKRQRRAFLKGVYDRPYAIRRNPTVCVL